MKTKRLAIILSIFAALVVVVVLCSTVFTIARVELRFYNTPIKLNTLSATEVAKKGEFNYHESVFVANKKLYTKNLEKTIPYIKVLQIETVFPNGMRVCAIERSEVFAIEKQSGYVICDSDFKVLNFGVGSYTSSWSNPILITGLAQPLADEYTSGRFIDKSAVAGMDKFALLENAFYMHGLDLPDLLALVRSVSIAGSNLVLATHDGVQILLHEAGSRLDAKVALALGVLERLSSPERVTGQIVVFTDADTGKLIGTYI